jgi:beta-lactamase regulating signal transducer with metallopeptidase domain
MYFNPNIYSLLSLIGMCIGVVVFIKNFKAYRVKKKTKLEKKK